MSANIRLVATDVDGTLADPSGQLTDRTLRILRDLHTRGVEITLVTGLNPWVARRYATTIAPWTRAVCLNGIFTLDHGRPAPGMYIDTQVAKTTAAIVHRLGYVPIVYGDDQVSRYLLQPAPRQMEGMSEVRKLLNERPFQPYTEVATLDELFSIRPAQVSVCDEMQRADTLYTRLMEAVGGQAYVVLQPGKRSWVEVSHPQARKDRGLSALADQMGIAPAEILYFGDSLNDLPVFEQLPYTVAMANARPEIKALAWQTTTSNGEDGVAHFLAEHFGIAF